MQEQKLNSEQKDETQLPSSPNNSNTDVVRSPNVVSTERELWNKIELELSEVSDFEIVKHEKITELKYKSNQKEKSICVSGHSMALFIQSFIFCMKKFAT